MKRYCFDTSGISNPLETMPEDIHESMWNAVTNCIVSGKIAVTVEIYEEMCHIPGKVGDCIRANEKAMVFEIGDPDLSWDWQTYIDHNVRMQEDYHGFISEYTGGSRKTICLNDLTIVALAKTLSLPVVSMETLILQGQKRRIPNICQSEGVPHPRFSDFLKIENLKF